MIGYFHSRKNTPKIQLVFSVLTTIKGRIKIKEKKLKEGRIIRSEQVDITRTHVLDVILNFLSYLLWYRETVVIELVDGVI